MYLFYPWKKPFFLVYFVGDGDCDLTCRADRYGFYNTFPEHAQNGALCNTNQGSGVP